MKVAGIETAPFWETCSPEVLLTRINRLTWAKRYCRGRAEDIHSHVQEHAEFLKGIYQQRFGGQNGSDNRKEG